MLREARVRRQSEAHDGFICHTTSGLWWPALCYSNESGGSCLSLDCSRLGRCLGRWRSLFLGRLLLPLKRIWWDPSLSRYISADSQPEHPILTPPSARLLECRGTGLGLLAQPWSDKRLPVISDDPPLWTPSLTDRLAPPAHHVLPDLDVVSP